MITQEYLKERLTYNPQTGVFIWNSSNIKGHVKKGKIAGSKDSRGYIKIQIDRKDYTAHRLAWLYEYGEWPKYTIDHINRIKYDNSINNLRDVTQAENNKNQKRRNT